MAESGLSFLGLGVQPPMTSLGSMVGYSRSYISNAFWIMLFPSTIMSSLFLPHGVRVLAAWLYGWRSILFLLPGALLCNLHFAGDRAFDRDILFGTAASLIAAPLAFAIGRSLGGAALFG